MLIFHKYKICKCRRILNKIIKYYLFNYLKSVKFMDDENDTKFIDSFKTNDNNVD